MTDKISRAEYTTEIKRAKGTFSQTKEIDGKKATITITDVNGNYELDNNDSFKITGDSSIFTATEIKKFVESQGYSSNDNSESKLENIKLSEDGTVVNSDSKKEYKLGSLMTSSIATSSIKPEVSTAMPSKDLLMSGLTPDTIKGVEKPLSNSLITVDLKAKDDKKAVADSSATIPADAPKLRDGAASYPTDEPELVINPVVNEVAKSAEKTSAAVTTPVVTTPIVTKNVATAPTTIQTPAVAPASALSDLNDPMSAISGISNSGAMTLANSYVVPVSNAYSFGTVSSYTAVTTDFLTKMLGWLKGSISPATTQPAQKEETPSATETAPATVDSKQEAKAPAPAVKAKDADWSMAEKKLKDNSFANNKFVIPGSASNAEKSSKTETKQAESREDAYKNSPAAKELNEKLNNIAEQEEINGELPGYVFRKNIHTKELEKVTSGKKAKEKEEKITKLITEIEKRFKQYESEMDVEQKRYHKDAIESYNSSINSAVKDALKYETSLPKELQDALDKIGQRILKLN